MKIKDTKGGITIDLSKEFLNRGEIIELKREYDKRDIKTIKNKNFYKNNKRK